MQAVACGEGGTVNQPTVYKLFVMDAISEQWVGRGWSHETLEAAEAARLKALEDEQVTAARIVEHARHELPKEPQ